MNVQRLPQSHQLGSSVSPASPMNGLFKTIFHIKLKLSLLGGLNTACLRVSPSITDEWPFQNHLPSSTLFNKMTSIIGDFNTNYIFSPCADMKQLCQSTFLMNSVQSTVQPGTMAYIHFSLLVIPLNKYAYHIAHIHPVMLIM